MRVAIVAEDETELEVEVDGCGLIRQVYRVREDGSLRRTYARRLTDEELDEVARLAGLEARPEQDE